MKKSQNILLVLFTFFISATLLASNLHFGPYLQSPKTDGITILWQTTEPVIGKIVYGISSENLYKNLSESEPTKLHKFKITGLKPNQKYYYQCIWENEVTQVFHFKTAPDKIDTPVRIVIVGDSRSQPEVFAKICKQISKFSPDIMIHSGDFVASGNKIEQWEPQFFKPAKELLSSIPLYPALGNHERKASYYFEHFTIHENEQWWSADYGSLHLIALNSNENLNLDSEQYKWLEEDLNTNKEKTWKMTLLHHPLFNVHPTRPINDIRYSLTPLFIKHNMDFVITGHDHYYNRTFPIGNMSEKQNGTIHITSAGGGAHLYRVVPRQYAAYYRSIHHFLILDVTENQINGRAISIDGDIFDTFSINKDQDFMADNFIEYEMFELEQQVKYSLGGLTPFTSQNNTISFDESAVIKTNFNKPVIGYYKWEVPDNWKLSSPMKGKISLNPGDSIIIPVKASSLSADMINSPILELHLEADNSSRNVLNTRPFDHYLGFKNQDFKVSFEDALFHRIRTADANDVKIILNYLKYFPTSNRISEAVNYLGIAFSKHSKEINFSILDDFLKENDSPENRYWSYPLYFTASNYNHYDEWLELADQFAPYKIDLSNQLFSHLSSRKEMNTLDVDKIWLLGPFPNEKNNGLNIIYEPEKKVDLSESYNGMKNNKLKWEQGEANDLGYVDLLSKFSPNEMVVSYAYTTFNTNAEGKVVLLFGSDDGAAIWVNGKEYFRINIGRGAKECDDIIPVHVKKGKNEILVKVAQGGGHWGFYLQILDKQGIIIQ